LGAPRPGSAAWLEAHGLERVPPGGVPPGGVPPGGIPPGGIPPGGIPPAGVPPAGVPPGALPPGLMRLVGRVAPFAAAAGVGLELAGIHPLQLYTQALAAYETRETGALRIGTMLNEQYKDVRETIVGLGKDFKLTAQEAVGAMETVGRAAGTRAMPGVRGAMAVARAYNMAPEHMAALSGRIALLGAEAAPNLAETVALHAQAEARGLTRLPVARFLEERATMAQVGGFGFAPMGEVQTGRLQELMGEFGPRAQANPAAYFAEQAQSMDVRNKGPLGAMLSWQALQRLAARKPFLDLGMPGQPGSRRLNIRESYSDQLIALENAAQLEDVRAAEFDEAQRQGGGNPEMAKRVYSAMVPGRNEYQTVQEYEAMARRAGGRLGIAESLRAPVTGVPSEADLLARGARYAPGYGVLRRPAEFERLSDTEPLRALETLRSNAAAALGGLVDMPSEMVKASQAFAAVLGKTQEPVQAVSNAFAELRQTPEALHAVLNQLLQAVPGRGMVEPFLPEGGLDRMLVDLLRKVGLPAGPGTQPRRPVP
jgi:hypothetical protein